MGKKEKSYNILAANRKSTYCMSPLIPDDGRVFVASDCQAVEPTVLLNLCNDKTLYSILYEMRDKRPIYSGEVLLTDSLYVTTMSSTPLLGSKIRELGDRWLDLWESDSNAAKLELGEDTYKIAKMICLGLQYGMQPTTLQKHLYENDVVMTKTEATVIYNKFWDSIPAAKNFRDDMVMLFTRAKKEKRPVVSPMGFPLPSGLPRNGFNYIIQSSVSCFIRRVNQLLLAPDFDVELVCVIHDEIVVSIKKEDTEKYRCRLKECEIQVNEEFGLTYPVLLGFNVANSFYELKG